LGAVITRIGADRRLRHALEPTGQRLPPTGSEQTLRLRAHQRHDRGPVLRLPVQGDRLTGETRCCQQSRRLPAHRGELVGVRFQCQPREKELAEEVVKPPDGWLAGAAVREELPTVQVLEDLGRIHATGERDGRVAGDLGEEGGAQHHLALLW